MTEVHDTIREWWDRDSLTYDEAKSHAISDPLEAATWRQALREALPEPPARVLDVGAGTGALSLLAAELGHDVTALDVSDGMLAVARRKAAELGVDLAFVVGSGMEPPAGPFDAIVERHVLWTLPDPDGALRAWRGVAAPGGRLVLLEGVWGQTDLVRRARDGVAEALRRLMRIPDDHHAPYPEEVLRALPLARQSSPLPMVQAVYRAGWTGVRVKRLRDVEWAAELHEPWPLGWLERRPRYALVADA
jgi:ubiquinone/menaquinone biosynthesis C-methylase UbiE